MVPNTVLAFLAMGLSLAAPSYGRARLAAGLAMGVGAVVSLRLLEFAGWSGDFVDRLFLKVPSERFGLAPLGKMALFTAIGFLAASVLDDRAERWGGGGRPATLGGGGVPGRGRDRAGLQPRLPVQPERPADVRDRVDPDGAEHGDRLRRAWAPA